MWAKFSCICFSQHMQVPLPPLLLGAHTLLSCGALINPHKTSEEYSITGTQNRWLSLETTFSNQESKNFLLAVPCPWHSHPAGNQDQRKHSHYCSCGWDQTQAQHKPLALSAGWFLCNSSPHLGWAAFLFHHWTERIWIYCWYLLSAFQG